MLFPTRIYDGEDDFNHNNANHGSHINGNHTTTYSKNYEYDSKDVDQVLSEPLLSSHCHPNDDCCNITRKNGTTNTPSKALICRTVTIRILYMMIGYLVGRECAILGFHIFGIYNDHHSILQLFLRYQFINNSNNNLSPTMLLQLQLPYRHTIASMVLAIIWSMSTVCVTFLVYQIAHSCMIVAMLHRERHPTEPKVPPIRQFCHMELLPPLDHDSNDYYYDDDHNAGVDHNSTIDENTNQLMITIGTCLGFTIVCFNIL